MGQILFIINTAALCGNFGLFSMLFVVKILYTTVIGKALKLYIFHAYPY